MKRLLLPLLAALALPTAVNTSIRIKPIYKDGSYVGKVKVLYKNDNYPFVIAEYPVYPYCWEAKKYTWSVLAGKPKSGRTGFFGKKEELSVTEVNKLLRSLENSIPLDYQDRQKILSKYASTFYDQFKIVEYPRKPFDCGSDTLGGERFPDWN